MVGVAPFVGRALTAPICPRCDDYIPPDDVVYEFGLARARMTAVANRYKREGSTGAVMEADREIQCEYGRLAGDVYRLFGASDDVLEEVEHIAAMWTRFGEEARWSA